MKTKMNFNMRIPTRILFGADELKNLHLSLIHISEPTRH